MRLNEPDERIEGHEYPTTSEALIESCGDRRIELQNGSETVGEVLGRMGGQTYERPQDVYDALVCGVGHGAIGRRFYSDRDPPTAGDDGPDQVSF